MASPASEIVEESFDYHQISASANIAAGNGFLGGIFVSAASGSPTLTVYDSATTTTSVKIVDTFTPVGATFYPMPARFQSGCYVVIGGTVSCTVFGNSRT